MPQVIIEKVRIQRGCCPIGINSPVIYVTTRARDMNGTVIPPLNSDEFVSIKVEVNGFTKSWRMVAGDLRYSRVQELSFDVPTIEPPREVIIKASLIREKDGSILDTAEVRIPPFTEPSKEFIMPPEYVPPAIIPPAYAAPVPTAPPTAAPTAPPTEARPPTIFEQYPLLLPIILMGAIGIGAYFLLKK
jgi:hypothetical protein